MAKARKLGAMYVQEIDKQVKPLDQVLTVDTGDNTGYAFWRNTDVQVPAHYGQITLPRRKGWETETELAWMWGAFNSIQKKLWTLEMGLPKTVVLESLEHWGTDEHSLAAIRSGKLFKLAYLIGGYAKIAQDWGAEVVFVKAREWKGQMNKEATKLRVARAIGQEFSSSHVTDAVGMGLSLMGIL